MESPDEEIANEAIQLIINYSYINLNPRLKKVRVLNSYVQTVSYNNPRKLDGIGKLITISLLSHQPHLCLPILVGVIVGLFGYFIRF